MKDIHKNNIEILGPPKNGKQYSFEECYPVILVEIKKRKPRWLLTRLAWIDYDDVTQIIISHIYNKWDQWDQKRALLPWVNKVITHQTQNIVRNIYTCYSKPCNRCSANEGEDMCRVYKTQCSACPLYAKWEKTKKNAQYINLAESLEHNEDILKVKQDTQSKLTYYYENINKMHESIMPLLTNVQKKVYKMLYIDNLDELEVAKRMGYRTSEKSRSAGYKQIEKFRKIFISHAKRFLKDQML